MSHLDPDQLTLIAVGEPVASADELDHLTSCAICTRDLSEMGRAVRLARLTMGEDTLEAPPQKVWDGIAAELGLSVRTAEPASVPEPVVPVPASPAPVRERVRRSGRGVWALAAAFVLIAAAGLGTWAVSTQLAPVSIAAASLDAFPDHPGAVGSADIEQARDGSRTLVVTLDAGAAADTYREVWLIRGDASALISLGVLTGDSGTFVIPDGVDLEEYSLVDISAEPIDGDPAHSGDSIVRGALSFA